MPLIWDWFEEGRSPPSHSHQLLLGNLKAFPGQLRDIITGKESDLLLGVGTKWVVRGRPLLLQAEETHVDWLGQLPRPLPAPSQGCRAVHSESLSRPVTIAFTIQEDSPHRAKRH